MSSRSSRSGNNDREDQHGSSEPDIMHNFITQDKNPSIGMTPSIITTINNTSPSPLIGDVQPEDASLVIKTRTRQSETCYESFIEDSFVGHWEREDDDPDNPYNQGCQPNHHHDTHEHPDEEPDLHPSTIEFDFDSFGPESFIYSPPLTNAQVDSKQQSELQPNQSATIDASDQTDDAETSIRNEFPSRSPSPVPIIKPSSDTSQAPGQSSNLNVNPQSSIKQPSPAPSPNRRIDLVTVDNLVDIAPIDYKVIEPYKRVISHAGYCHHIDPYTSEASTGDAAPAVIVFSACYLPDRSRRDYDYVMDHLFLYVLLSLHELIADDYILIYLHNTQPSTSSSFSPRFSTSTNNLTNNSTPSTSTDQQSQNNLPKFSWMKRCYQMIDRRLRKNLKVLYLVKPTLWLKTIVIMCRPFISSKFSKKLHFIQDMNELRKCIPVDRLTLPASAESI